MSEDEAHKRFVDAVMLYQARRMEEAGAIIVDLLATTPDFFARTPPALVMVALVSVWLGDYGKALEDWRRSQDLTAVTPSPLAAGEGLALAHDAGGRPVPGRPLAIGTSLQPKRIEAQQAAISTWMALGATVLSVNNADEIAALAGLFPGVTFVPTERTGQTAWGRPFVAISALLDALAATGTTVVGLVNSDILIASDPAVAEMLTAESENALLFGNRIDIDDLHNLNGQPMERGFDYFFLRARDIGHFRDNDYYMGLPWWDFWMAHQAGVSGLAVRRIATPIAFHVKHPQAWSMASFVAFRNLFIRHISTVLQGAVVPSPAQRYLAALLADYDDQARQRVTLQDTPSPEVIRATENLAFHMSEFIFSTAEPVMVS